MVVADSNQNEPLYMTETEYLEYEESSEINHEYVDGRVYAMTGASLTHGLICQNTATTLANQLADTPCLVIANDLRLRVDAKKSYRYPDVIVICDDPKYVDNRVDTISNPTIIVEVLSPSTALVDHNMKLDEYTQLDSVQAYILISQHEAKAEVYTRQDEEKWTYRKAKGLDDKIDLLSVGCVLELSNIYSKVNFKNSDAS